MRKFQIGVIGSTSDLKYSKQIEEKAKKIGELIARKNGILIFGAEKDFDSLSTSACRGAKQYGGLTVGITYGKTKNILQKDVDVIIPCGSERGGGREFVFILCCDAIISISGGSGTLNELTVAYQADIPMVALKGYGGWTDKLSGQYLDDRKRRKILLTNNPKEAVEKAFCAAEKYRKKYEK